MIRIGKTVGVILVFLFAQAGFCQEGARLDEIEIVTRSSIGGLSKRTLKGRILDFSKDRIQFRSTDGKLQSFSTVGSKQSARIVWFEGRSNAAELLKKARVEAGMASKSAKTGDFALARRHAVSAKSIARRIHTSSAMSEDAKILAAHSSRFLDAVVHFEVVHRVEGDFYEMHTKIFKVFASAPPGRDVLDFEFKQIQEFLLSATAAHSVLNELEYREEADRALILSRGLSELKSLLTDLNQIRADVSSVTPGKIVELNARLHQFFEKYSPEGQKPTTVPDDFVESLVEKFKALAAFEANQKILKDVKEFIEKGDELARKENVSSAVQMLADAEHLLKEMIQPISKNSLKSRDNFLTEISSKSYQPENVIVSIEANLDSGFIPNLLEQLKYFDRHFPQHPDSARLFQSVAESFDNHTAILLENHRLSEAITFISDTIEFFPKVESQSKSNYLIGNYLVAEGDQKNESGQTEEAQDAYQRAMDFLEKGENGDVNRDQLKDEIIKKLKKIPEEKNMRLLRLIGVAFLFLLGGGAGFWIGEVAVKAKDRKRRFVFERVGLIFARIFQFFSRTSDQILHALNTRYKDSGFLSSLLHGLVLIVAVVFFLVPMLIVCFVLLSTMLWLTIPVCVFAVVAYIPLRTVHFLWLRVSGQKYVCPNLECRQAGGEGMPLYECECGIKYDRLYPNFYGLFNHVCLNKRKHRHAKDFRLPTLEIFRKPLGLKRFCPDPTCGAELVSGRARHCPILVYGGESSGKTVFVYQAISSLLSKVNSATGGRAELVGKYSADVQKVIDDLGRGIRPSKTAGTLFHAIGVKVKLPNQRREKLIQFYDVDGMRFLKIEDILKMQAIEKIEGVVFLVDPFSLPELSWEADRVENEDAPSESPLEKLIENLDQGVRHILLQNRVNRKTSIPLAVVLSKIDAAVKSQHSYIQGLQSAGRDLSQEPAKEIFQNLSAVDLFSRFSQTFSSVYYYTCSGLGRSAPTNKGASFAPVGVLDPVLEIALTELRKL